MRSLQDQIMHRVQTYERGQRVFSSRDFLDLGGRAAVDQVLCRLAKAGTLRRVSRGFYDWPRQSPTLNAPAPVDADAAVSAVSRRVGSPVIRDGLAAANALGLTTAVPTRMDFVSAAKATDVVVGGWRVKVSKAPAAVRPWIGSDAATIVQALVWARAAGFSLSDAARTIAKNATAEATRDLARNFGRLPGWAVEPARIIVAIKSAMSG